MRAPLLFLVLLGCDGPAPVDAGRDAGTDAGPDLPDSGPIVHVDFPPIGSVSEPSGEGSFRFGAASAATQIEDMNPTTDWYAWTAPEPEGLARSEFVGDAVRGYTLAID